MLADEDGDSGLFGTWTRGEKQLSLVLIVVLLYHFNVFSFVHRSRFRHTERARAPASARARTLTQSHTHDRQLIHTDTYTQDGEDGEEIKEADGEIVCVLALDRRLHGNPLLSRVSRLT